MCRFRRQCFVSVEPDESPAKYGIQEIGNDNLVISTDWPHGDSRYPQAIDTFLSLEGISDDSKRKIRGRGDFESLREKKR